MKTLDLILKKKWYDMIASGEKKEEYRELTDYWGRRLTTIPNGMLLFSYRNGYEPIPFKHFDDVNFHLGYAKDRPTMNLKVEGIEVREGRPEWGAEPGKKYYVIKLGERRP